MRIVVIGGGPAGMMAAGAAAVEGGEVMLLEKNGGLGRKLSITGKGRCNVTNARDTGGLLDNTPGNPSFLRGAFAKFSSARTMSFFEDLGVKLTVERGQRVFPESGKAEDIVSAMERYLLKNRVGIRLNATVADINFDKIKTVKAGECIYKADCVILASGGLSYPVTGSTGDGYRFAQKAGHNVTTLWPSLTPMRTLEPWVSELQGLALKNAGIVMRNSTGVVYKDFGELLFTHFGVSGPVILSASRFYGNGDAYEIHIDLKPALDEHTLDSRILRDFQLYKNKDFINALDDLLPRALIPVIVRLSGVSPVKKVNGITKIERKTLVQLIKCLRLSISGLSGFEDAVITRGGVDVKGVNPSTMESKFVKGLYFAGEILDVDALTGGYNLQIAFSTGFTAGRAAGRE
ncbi:MAG: NAD(P)/FAD-dependent oxidoreductase [Clostridiales bacterium]|jgi:predicted Rossmann fold flavoprotein|nr:NAD(P)/FAD-dependent oxidoreductase [Clostridiales bacterium]